MVAHLTLPELPALSKVQILKVLPPSLWWFPLDAVLVKEEVPLNVLFFKRIPGDETVKFPLKVQLIMLTTAVLVSVKV